MPWGLIPFIGPSNFFNVKTADTGPIRHACILKPEIILDFDGYMNNFPYGTRAVCPSTIVLHITVVHKIS
jgi:hypothetical protein